MTKKEQRRLMVLNGIEIGRITAREASEVLDVSLCHVRRLLAAYRKEGAAGLSHGNRGSKPHNALDDGLKRRVLELAQSTTLAITLSSSLSFWQNVMVSLFPALRCVLSYLGWA